MLNIYDYKTKQYYIQSKIIIICECPGSKMVEPSHAIPCPGSNFVDGRLDEIHVLTANLGAT
jgi:hypothetical protein